MSRSRLRALAVVLGAVLACSAAGRSARAQTDDEIGFGNLESSSSETVPPNDADDSVGFGGLDSSAIATADDDDDDEHASTTYSITVRADSAVWTERLGSGGFAKLRFTSDPRVVTRYRDFRFALGLRAEGDAAYAGQAHHSPRVQYDTATRDTYAWVLRPGETFVAWERPRGELATGFQTRAIGQGEALTVVDLLNPRDLREPGLTALDDARIPILMTRGGFFGEHYRVEVVVTHQTYFRLVPPPLGQWSPIRAALLEDPELVSLGIAGALATKDIAWAQEPRMFGARSQSILARATWERGPFSIGGYAGYVIDPQGVARLPDAATLAQSRFSIPLEHRHFGMIAGSFAYTKGAFAVFAEAALDIERPINVLADSPVDLLIDRRTLARWMGGGRYTNARGGVLTIEYAQGLLHAIGRDDPPPLVPTSVATIVARYEHAFARDAWRFGSVVAVTGQGLRGGGFGRVELAWVPMDGLRLTAGYAIFVPTDEPSAIRGFERHDRAMLSIRWDDSWTF